MRPVPLYSENIIGCWYKFSLTCRPNCWAMSSGEPTPKAKQARDSTRIADRIHFSSLSRYETLPNFSNINNIFRLGKPINRIIKEMYEQNYWVYNASNLLISFMKIVLLPLVVNNYDLLINWCFYFVNCKTTVVSNTFPWWLKFFKYTKKCTQWRAQ